LADSAKIQEEDASHLNRHRRPGEPEIHPLYDYRDVRRTMKLARAVPYETEHDVGGARVRFLDAGHLLGSAIVHLDFDGGKSITFTGDLGRKDMPILRDPAPIPPADLLISECTYGGRNHPGVEML